MSAHLRDRSRGFTLSELMIGLSLSMIVMAAILSSYIYIARAYVRTIGFGEPNQPTLESQGRRTLATFAQDVQSASGLMTSPSSTYPLSASEVTLIVPRSTGGTKYVTYYYNSSSSATTVTKGASSVTVTATSLTRIDWSTVTALTLHSSLASCTLTYYDVFADIDVTGTARSYTTYVNYLTGIKQITLALSARAGTGANQTQLYQITSPRYILRNRAVLY
ncbi:MAG: hypothetical protein FJ399_08365 [Verrucomicrobia bacterium]|nr:hypothetical protein [Verrucomicrobiota bacterium]